MGGSGLECSQIRLAWVPEFGVWCLPKFSGLETMTSSLRTELRACNSCWLGGAHRRVPRVSLPPCYLTPLAPQNQHPIMCLWDVFLPTHHTGGGLFTYKEGKRRLNDILSPAPMSLDVSVCLEGLLGALKFCRNHCHEIYLLTAVGSWKGTHSLFSSFPPASDFIHVSGWWEGKLLPSKGVKQKRFENHENLFMYLS